MANTTTIKLRKWQHPNSGELRVYVNSNALSYGEKAYFTEKGMMEGKCTLVVYTEGTNKDLIESMLYEEVADTFDIDSLDWEDVQEAAA